MMRTGYILAACVLASACATATVDKQSVRATQNAPESTQVDVVRIPYDPALPRYVVTVEPLAFDADSSPSVGSAPPTPGTHYGWGPYGWGVLPEGPHAQAQNGGKPGNLVHRDKREVGPFVVRGSVTEFNEIAEASGKSSGGSLGGLGVALGVAGAIAGNAPAAYTGAGLAVANPTYENTVARRTGSVAMDLTIVNPRDGRLVGSVMANGSFTSESAANGFSLFGFGRASNAYAASALGQANRAAMNSATTQIADRLRSVR